MYLTTCLLMVVSVATASGTPPRFDEQGTTVPDGPVGVIHGEFPDAVDPGARYLIYLHNRFAENTQPGDRHPIFGVYDFHGILEAFAEQRFIVIAEQREPQADPAVWATRVALQVKHLIDAGVPPENITVVGFSKGGAIAILSSSELADDRINFVFLAACGDWVDRVHGLEPRGRLLSIIEASDDMAGTCEQLFAKARDKAAHEEIEIQLGGGHGAFFAPEPEWTQPAMAWASGRSLRNSEPNL